MSFSSSSRPVTVICDSSPAITGLGLIESNSIVGTAFTTMLKLAFADQKPTLFLALNVSVCEPRLKSVVDKFKLLETKPSILEIHSYSSIEISSDVKEEAIAMTESVSPKLIKQFSKSMQLETDKIETSGKSPTPNSIETGIPHLPSSS